MNLVFLKRQLFLTCLMVGGILFQLGAQNGANPFDLEHRLSKKTAADQANDAASEENPFDLESRSSEESTPEAPPKEKEVANENPFDIQRIQPTLGKSSPQKEVLEEKPLKAPSEDTVNTKGGFLVWTNLGMMIFLALLVTLYRSLISKIYRAFVNENILKLLQREQNVFIAIPYLFLYILFFISAGIFTFQVGYYYKALSFEFENLAYCILGVMAVFLLKHIVLKIIEFVFPIGKEVKQYSFTIIIFSIILGILLIPFNIFIAFAPPTLTFASITGALFTIIAVYLFRALRGVFIGSKFLAFHKFHFFMYLCAVEIAPLLILMKVLFYGAIIH